MSRQMLRIVIPALVVAGLAVVACQSAKSAPTAMDLALEGTALMAEVVGEVVPDEERAARSLAVLASYQQVEKAYFESLIERRRELRELNADYEAPQERFAELFDAFNAERRTFKDVTVATFVELHEHLEPAEWGAVFEGLRGMDEKWEELAR